MDEINSVLNLITKNIDSFPDCIDKETLKLTIHLLNQAKNFLEQNFTKEQLDDFFQGKGLFSFCQFFTKNFGIIYKFCKAVRIFFSNEKVSYSKNFAYLVQAVDLFQSFFNIFQLWTTYQSIAKADNLKDELKKTLENNKYEQRINILMNEIDDLYDQLLKCFESYEKGHTNKFNELYNKLNDKIEFLDLMIDNVLSKIQNIVEKYEGAKSNSLNGALNSFLDLALNVSTGSGYLSVLSATLNSGCVVGNVVCYTLTHGKIIELENWKKEYQQIRNKLKTINEDCQNKQTILASKS